MPRQFSLKTLLWLMASVACFFGGMVWQYRVLGIRASEREQELDRRNRGLADQVQNLVLDRGRLYGRLEKASKKLADAGIPSGEIDKMMFR
jgi:hypothetical protein